MRWFLLNGLAVALLAGCGSGPAPTTSPPTPTARLTPSPTATPTPAPDVQRIDVVSTGVGTWQLVAVPVAVIHNAATRSTVTGAFVHLTPTRHGAPLTPLVTPAVTLYPGQTLVVAANCTDTCLGADGASVTVTPGTWSVATGEPPTATGGAITCTVSCHGHGQWDIAVTVGGPALVANEQVNLFALCANAAGVTVGGGQRSLLWPQAGGTLDLDVPVIVNAPPASCRVSTTASN